MMSGEDLFERLYRWSARRPQHFQLQRSRMKLVSLLTGIALAVGLSASADAAIYDFSIHSDNYDVVGQITTTGNLVTSLVGQVTGLLTAPIDGLDGQFNVFYTSDNLLNSVAPFV